MKIMKNSGFTGSLLLVGVLLLVGGCGYKNTPVPPNTVVPKAIEDLRYNVVADGARLTWSYPIETVSGKNISKVESFELFRAEVPLVDFCGGCPIPFGEPTELPGGVNSEEKRRIAEHESGLLRSGTKYFFKVRSRTSWWASSDDSNIVTFVYHTPASAPTGMLAISGESAITLKWSRVTTLVDGKPVDLSVNYQVMRSSDGKEFVEIGTPLAETMFVDTEVQMSKKYNYKVKSLMMLEDDTLLQGKTSDSVLAVVVDITPPSVVTGVTVVASSKNNRIFWDRIKNEDLAGYRIYRRTAKQKSATLIGEASATQTIFVDENVPQNTKVYYSITAIDIAKPANESKKSKEATLRH